MLSIVHGHAQSTNNLPYSRYGIGQNPVQGTVRNHAMGGIGIASTEVNTIHYLNPASLGGSQLTFADASFRLNANYVSRGESYQSNQSGNLGYIFISLPFSKRWNTVIGLSPGAEVSFDYTDNIPLGSGSTTLIEKEIRGAGNISNIHLTNALKVTESFSLGLEMVYGYGNIQYFNSYRLLNPTPDRYKTVLIDQVRYNNITGKLGGYYRKAIDKAPEKGRESRVVGFGATAEYGQGLNVDRTVTSERWNAISNSPYLFKDSVITGRVPLTLPLTVGIGASLARPGRWMIEADIFYTQWTMYKNEARPESLNNSLGLRMGGYVTPNPGGNFIKRTTYRWGVFALQTPLIIDNQRINDVGISFGTSLPVDKFSRMNLAFIAGRRGMEGSVIVQENYLQLSIGYSLVDRWFVKYKID